MAWCDTQNQRLIGLVKQAVEHALAHPEQFVMAWYSNKCGTLLCLGGRMALLSNDSIIKAKRKSDLNGRCSDWLLDNSIHPTYNPSWRRLFFLGEWPGHLSHKSQLRERFAYWLETGK